MAEPAARSRARAVVFAFLVLFLALVAVATKVVRDRGPHLEPVLAGLQTIATAQEGYFEREGRYAASLAELERAGLLGGTLAAGTKEGYRFATRADGDAWSATAEPFECPVPAALSFFRVDRTGVRRVQRGRPAGPASAPAR